MSPGMVAAIPQPMLLAEFNKEIGGSRNVHRLAVPGREKAVSIVPLISELSYVAVLPRLVRSMRTSFCGIVLPSVSIRSIFVCILVG